MSTPIIESIAENIKTAVNLITVANGFNQTLTAVRPKRNDFYKTAWDDLTVLISQAEAEELEGGYGTKEWRQNFMLVCIVIDSDDATASIDTRLNQVAADIFKKLLQNNRGFFSIFIIFIGNYGKFKWFSIFFINFTFRIHFKSSLF